MVFHDYFYCRASSGRNSYRASDADASAACGRPPTAQGSDLAAGFFLLRLLKMRALSLRNLWEEKKPVLSAAWIGDLDLHIVLEPGKLVCTAPLELVFVGGSD